MATVCKIMDPVKVNGMWVIFLPIIQVRFGLSVEEMIAGKDYINDPRINSDNFPHFKDERIRTIDKSLAVVRPVPANLYHLPFISVMRQMSGFIGVDLPLLSALKSISLDLWWSRGELDIHDISVTGYESTYFDDCGTSSIITFRISPQKGDTGFHLQPVGHGYLDDSWILCEPLSILRPA
jgi:hypothetical protein